MDRKKTVLVLVNALTDGEVSQIKQMIDPKNDQLIDIQLNLVHVVANLPNFSYRMPSLSLLIDKYLQEAKNVLVEIGQELNVPANDQWLISGKVRTEVLKLATRIDASLILAGDQQIKTLSRSLFFKNIRQFVARNQMLTLCT